MEINELVKRLGYEDSPFYLSKPDFNKYPGQAHIFRKSENECSLRGVYTLAGDNRSDTVIPVVYICEARSEEEALEIHKRVWNQNIVPFLIVSAPRQFRLYPGFSYNRKSDGTGSQSILEIAKSANEVLDRLSDFDSNSINTGRIWKKWGKEVSQETRVDRKLLGSLKKIQEWLKKEGLSRNTAHALIGKYVYLHYLKDRNILSDKKFNEWKIDKNSVFGRSATLKGFQAVIKKLEEWLNGSLFPIPEDGKNAPQTVHIQKVASIFSGDDTSGQMCLDFEAYEFGYIPIETLSVVYQQFLHTEGRDKAQGAFYTPVHLVNFILDELDARRRLQKGMKVFDPACGSGAFLVQCYRLIIERELAKNTKAGLRPSELRDLLTEHIYGLDVDEDACGVTELSLVLTLLDYVDPPDLEKACYKRFRLPVLRNQNIFHCEGGFFAPDSEFQKSKKAKDFDWITGNPPWKELPRKNEKKEDQAALEWSKNNSKKIPVGNNQLAEAFAWKVTRYLSKQGIVGLLMPAASLVKSRGEKFRKEFFTRMDVWCVVNFSNLRRILFEVAVNPAAAFFYSLPDENREQESRILTYAPFAVNQIFRDNFKKNEKLWNITVSASEIRDVLQKDAASGSGLPWKVAMWGSFRDKRLLNSLSRQFDSLAKFAEYHKLHLHEGPHLCNEDSNEKKEFIQDVVGQKKLSMKSLYGCRNFFSFPEKALNQIEREQAYLIIQSGKKSLNVCYPPHIIINQARTFAIFSNEFIVVPSRQIGISGKKSDINLLKSLALYLNSNFTVYHQRLISSFWGIERDTSTKKDIDNLPVPLDFLSDKDLKKWASLHDEIVKQDIGKNTNRLAELLAESNESVYQLLKITDPERWLVEDFLNVRMKLNDGKVPEDCIRPANQSEIQEYAEVLKSELDNFLDNGETKDFHKISVYYTEHLAMLKIEHPEKSPAGPVSVFKVQDSEIEKEFSKLKGNLLHEKGQWIYFERNLKYYEGRTTYFVKPLQRLDWLKSQALLDADEFIAEKLG